MQFLEYLLGVGMLKAQARKAPSLEPGSHWLQRLGLPAATSRALECLAREASPTASHWPPLAAHAPAVSSTRAPSPWVPSGRAQRPSCADSRAVPAGLPERRAAHILEWPAAPPFMLAVSGRPHARLLHRDRPGTAHVLALVSRHCRSGNGPVTAPQPACRHRRTHPARKPLRHPRRCPGRTNAGGGSGADRKAPRHTTRHPAADAASRQAPTPRPSPRPPRLMMVCIWMASRLMPLEPRRVARGHGVIEAGR